jgi:hypothetical protein
MSDPENAKPDARCGADSLLAMDFGFKDMSPVSSMLGNEVASRGRKGNDK